MDAGFRVKKIISEVPLAAAEFPGKRSIHCRTISSRRSPSFGQVNTG